MRVLEKLGRLLAVSDDPELVQAQARALTRQVPLLYCMLLTNTLLLAWTHYGIAPTMLTVHVPAALALACAARLTLWWKKRKRVLGQRESESLLRSMIFVAAALSIGFVVWSLSLYPFGDAYQQSHVAFYMGITTIGCMFCLSTVRGAALMVGLCVLGPFITFFALSGNPIFGAMALNMVLVIAVLLIILLQKYDDFAQLVASRTAMQRKQEETQRLSDDNERLATFDSLTGLPNRRQLLQRVEHYLRRSEATGQPIAVAQVNIDAFKCVNETFGHSAGDKVLAEMARRIMATTPPNTFIARLNGDSFALVFPDPLDDAELELCGALISQAVRRPYTFAEATLHVSASSGFASAKPGDTAESLYDRADYATSVAKRERRGEAVVFSDRHAAEISKVRRLEHALHTADLEREIYILFQPQFDVSLGQVSGYEVLARWRSPELGEISPGEFIPLAERTGIITKITQTVLGKALAVSRALPRPIRLSVNLSAHDIASATAVERIAAMVQGAGAPCPIDFEITETAVMRDLRQANDALLALLSLGARIALDDFGTGHSSLTHVQKLPLDRIKIDRSFVAEVTNDPTSRAIIKTMVDLCRNLGISCVFEGIETEEQLDALLSLGGTIMQGYLFGRPMSEEALFASLPALVQAAPQASSLR
jgi:diguanylate cyclase (GGDEF)-like protein